MKYAKTRCLIHVFYNTFDLAVINALVDFKKTTSSNKNRRAYILKFTEELRDRYVSMGPEVIRPLIITQVSKKRKVTR